MIARGQARRPDAGPRWEHIDCPVCGSRSFSPLFEKSGEQFVQCSECRLVLINPRPRFDRIAPIYAARYSQRYVSKRETKMRRARRQIGKIRRFIQSGRWLDVGCSAGFILAAADEAGFEAYGCDIDPTGLAYCEREFGIKNLYHGLIHDAGFPSAYFDVVTLYDVLEHVCDLNATVAELRRILAPGGIIEIWTPDVGHWRRPRALDRWSAILPSKHLYYFDVQTLTRLVARHGLRIVKKRICLKPGLRAYLGHA